MDNTFNAGNGVQYGMLYEPDNFQVIGAVQGVGQQVGVVSAQIQEGMGEVIKKMNSVTRKKRKSYISRQLATGQDGTILFVKYYDDGTQDIVPFIMNIRGNSEVYGIRFQEKPYHFFWGIYFSTSQCWITGRREKVRKSYLLERFIKEGVLFNAQIPHSTVAEVLFEVFAPEIERTNNVLTLSANAGWFEGEFYHAGNFPFGRNEEFFMLPVLKKKFVIAEPFEGCWECYFEEMKNIVRWEDRAVIMLFPFFGIIKSILEAEHCDISLALNFVKAHEFPVQKICSWLQVFNREKLFPICPTGSEKEWMGIVATYKDEVMLTDFSVSEGEIAYEKRKLAFRLIKTLDYINGKFMLPGMDGESSTAAFATISTEFQFRDGVYNIILDDECYQNDAVLDVLSEYNSIAVLFSRFVSYLKGNFEVVRAKLCSAKRRYGVGSVQIVWEIIRDFWNQEGIQVEQEAQLPSDISFKAILEENSTEAEYLIKVFVQAVRKEAPEYFFANRGKSSLGEGRILYDEDYLWILTSDLKKILLKNGMKSYASRILLELKEKGCLQSDEGRLTKKLQVGNIRQPTYQISRKIFSRLGQVDIVDLGKERKIVHVRRRGQNDKNM